MLATQRLARPSTRIILAPLSDRRDKKREREKKSALQFKSKQTLRPPSGRGRRHTRNPKNPLEASRDRYVHRASPSPSLTPLPPTPAAARVDLPKALLSPPPTSYVHTPKYLASIFKFLLTSSAPEMIESNAPLLRAFHALQAAPPTLLAKSCAIPPCLLLLFFFPPSPPLLLFLPP